MTTIKSYLGGQTRPFLTLVSQQSFIQELGGRSKMDRDVRIGEVIHLDAHVLDVHARIERLASVDPSAVGGVEDVGDAHALQASLVYGNSSEKGSHT